MTLNLTPHKPHPQLSVLGCPMCGWSRLVGGRGRLHLITLYHVKRIPIQCPFCHERKQP